jgi:16S rRNA (cytidine1402-2'-O)-methyltransferase
MGTLFVVATPIGNLEDMTPRAIATLRSVSLIAAEDTRHTGQLLRAFDITTPTISYHHHNRAARQDRLLAALTMGDVALVSDAGTPAIADPGHELIAAAIAAGHRIVPIPGASSMLAAVSASGIVEGPFVFVGFLPRVGDDRARALSRALGTGLPFVLFESPIRTPETLRDLAALSPDRHVVVGRELTKIHEEFLRGLPAELSHHFEVTPPRGEVVIVVGNQPEVEHLPDDGGSSATLALSLLTQGMKPSKVAREVSSTTGLDSAAAYDLVQRIRRDSE